MTNSLMVTPSQKFSIGKRVEENGVTTMLRYYCSKILPGMARLHAPEFYLLGIAGSCLFRRTAGLLIH